MKEQITYDDFDKIDIRVGTVILVKKNEKARKPSLVIEVDFGKDIGIKQSSAQITHYYNEENLKEYMKWDSILIEVNLNLGNETFECYTCDFTHDYIDINADYRN